MLHMGYRMRCECIRSIYLVIQAECMCRVGIPFAMSSRLIPRHYFSSDPRGVAQALRNGQIASGAEIDSQAIQVLIDLPSPSFNLGKTSVTPAWYNSLWHVIYTGTWNTSTSVSGQRAEVSSLHEAANVLRAFAPDGGAYSNEADIYEYVFLSANGRNLD